jgi:hypothetical protein
MDMPTKERSPETITQKTAAEGRGCGCACHSGKAKAMMTLLLAGVAGLAYWISGRT